MEIAVYELHIRKQYFRIAETRMQGVLFFANSMTLFSARSLCPNHFDLMSALRRLINLYRNFLHKALHIMDFPTPAWP